MGKVFGSLLLGLLLGLIPGAKRWQRASKLLGTVGVMLLLASMGVELGGNAAIMESLSQIGIAALLLALAAVAGSLLLAWPLIPVFRNMTAGQEESGEA